MPPPPRSAARRSGNGAATARCWRTAGRSTGELVREIVREENDKVKAAMGEEAYAGARYEDAARLMIDLVEQPVFQEFLTLPAYDRILADEKQTA